MSDTDTRIEEKQDAPKYTLNDGEFPTLEDFSTSIRIKKRGFPCRKLFVKLFRFFHKHFWSFQCCLCVNSIYMGVLIIAVSCIAAIVGLFSNFSLIKEIMDRDCLSLEEHAESVFDSGKIPIRTLREYSYLKYDNDTETFFSKASEPTLDICQSFVPMIKESHFSNILLVLPNGGVYVGAVCFHDPNKICCVNQSEAYSQLFVHEFTNNKLERIPISPPPADIRDRPWYSQAIESETDLIWGSPYVIESGGVDYMLGFCLSTALHLDQNLDLLIGVLSLCLDLGSLQTKLVDGEFSIGGQATVFIVDREGLLLSSSRGEVTDCYEECESMPNRIEPKDSIDAIIQSVSSGFEENYDTFDAVYDIFAELEDDDSLFLEFSHEGNHIRCNYFKDLDTGLELLFVVSVPSDIYYESLKIELGIIFGITFIIFCLNILFSCCCGVCIRRAIKSYSKEIEKIGNLDTQPKFHNFTKTFGLYEFTILDNSLLMLSSGLLNFSKFLPDSLKGYILSKQTQKLRQEMYPTEVSVFFCDLVDFTHLSETLSSEELLKLVGTFFYIVTNCVKKYEGVVDKYIGDCVMSYFRKTHEMKSVSCAMEILERVEKIHFKVTIGINSGKVLMGCIGYKDRFTFSIFGDVVNVASRLQGACKDFGVDLLVGERTVDSVRHFFQFRKVRLEGVKIRGKEEVIHVFTIGDGKEKEEEEEEEFNCISEIQD